MAVGFSGREPVTILLSSLEIVFMNASRVPHRLLVSNILYIFVFKLSMSNVSDFFCMIRLAQGGESTTINTLSNSLHLYS